MFIIKDLLAEINSTVSKNHMKMFKVYTYIMFLVYTILYGIRLMNPFHIIFMQIWHPFTYILNYFIRFCCKSIERYASRQFKKTLQLRMSEYSFFNSILDFFYFTRLFLDMIFHIFEATTFVILLLIL